MFEKEADEWIMDCVCKDCSLYGKCKSKEHCTCKECSKDKWQNGAEFGYNKANEWHYVKDGDLPKNSTAVLVILKNKRMKISTFMENKFTIWNNDYDAYTKLYDVIAWHELPKFEE